MKTQFVIEVQPRDELGKNAARRLRRRGKIPAVVYGGGREPVGVEVDPRPVEAVLASKQGVNTLIQLRLAGRDLRRMVMIREAQRDPVTGRLLHADFRRVEMDRPVTVEVPIELEGTPVGVKNEGGLVEFVTRSVEIRALPGDIPEVLKADIAGLHVGQHLEAKDLPLPDGVELLAAPTETVVTVVGKAAAAEEEEAAAAEAGAEEAPGEAAEGAAPAGETGA